MNLLKKYNSLPVEASLFETDNINSIFTYSITATPGVVASLMCFFIVSIMMIFLTLQILNKQFIYTKYQTVMKFENLMQGYQIPSQLNLSYLIISSLFLLIGKLILFLVFKFTFLETQKCSKHQAFLAQNELSYKKHKKNNIKIHLEKIFNESNNEIFFQRFDCILQGIAKISVFILINNSLFILEKLGVKIDSKDLLHKIAQLMLSIIICNFIFPYIDDINILDFIEYNHFNLIYKKYPSEEKIYECPSNGDLIIQTGNLSEFFSIFSNMSLKIKKGEKVLITGKKEKARLLYLIMGITCEKESWITFDKVPTNQIKENFAFQILKKYKNIDQKASVLLLDDVPLYKKTDLKKITQLSQTVIIVDSAASIAKEVDIVIFVSDKTYIDSHKNLLKKNNDYKLFIQNCNS